MMVDFRKGKNVELVEWEQNSIAFAFNLLLNVLELPRIYLYAKLFSSQFEEKSGLKSPS